jgi:hypothetical protein
VFLKPQTFEDQVRPVSPVEPAPTVIAPPVTPPAVAAPPVVATPVVAPRVTAPPASAPPVKARPAAPLAQAAPASGSSASGNSASFEAALAAIRAAWAKPESTPATPAAAAPASPVAVTPLAGSSEVDLTNQVDALEDITVVDGSSPATDGDALDDANPSKGRRKTDRPVKRPEKPRARRTGGADDRDDRADGRSDWGVFDSSQYELSALVNKLDEVTDSDKVTTRATNRR